jgi:transcriptional regulator with XRE-family HTH domain
MLLKEYLEDHDMTAAELARLLNCSHVSASYWLSGRTRPSPKHTAQIYDLTGGKVTADDLQRGWELANERS